MYYQQPIHVYQRHNIVGANPFPSPQYTLFSLHMFIYITHQNVLLLIKCVYVNIVTFPLQ